MMMSSSSYLYNRLVFILLLAVITTPATAVFASPEAETVNTDYRALALSVFDQTNMLRANPVQYVDILSSRRSRFNGMLYVRDNSPVRLVTQEGVAPYNEAIDVLATQIALPQLQWSDRLANIAAAHVKDTGPKGITGHISSSGDNFSKRAIGLDPGDRAWGAAENISYGTDTGVDVVVQLFIDDGVPGRGHRFNLLNAQMRYSGVSCGYHKKFRSMCVAVYSYGTE
jgi:uncharacterized protein YkwD